MGLHGIAACLRAVTRGINLPIDEGLAVEAASFAATVPTDGVRNGLRRFLDRSAASGQFIVRRNGTLGVCLLPPVSPLAAALVAAGRPHGGCAAGGSGT
jgi:hypothetical protein